MSLMSSTSLVEMFYVNLCNPDVVFLLKTADSHHSMTHGAHLHYNYVILYINLVIVVDALQKNACLRNAPPSTPHYFVFLPFFVTLRLYAWLFDLPTWWQVRSLIPA